MESLANRMLLGSRESWQRGLLGDCITPMERWSHLTANQSHSWIRPSWLRVYRWGRQYNASRFVSGLQQCEIRIELLVAAIAEGSCYSEIHGIVADITLLASSMEFVSFRSCNHNSVSFEDGLAKQRLGSLVPDSD